MVKPTYWGVGRRVRVHGIIKGLRYSLGVWALYPVLNARYKFRQDQYEASKDTKGVETLARANMWNTNPGEERYSGTIAEMVGEASVSIDVVERLQAWKASATREGFQRGAWLESLSIVRCDIPEEESHG